MAPEIILNILQKIPSHDGKVGSVFASLSKGRGFKTSAGSNTDQLLSSNFISAAMHEQQIVHN